MTKNQTISISIITPFYNESDCAEGYFKTIVPILKSVTQDWEIVCVDDGSVDDTLKMLTKFAKRAKKRLQASEGL